MNAPRETVNPRSHSIGIDQRLVRVMDLPPGQNLAICADRGGTEVRVPLYWLPGKGALPQVGENWLLTQEMGRWAFSVFVGSGAGAFPGAPSPWAALELGTSWAAVTGYHAPSYRLTGDGDTQVAGRVTGLTSGVIAVLPAGFFSAAAIISAPCSVSASTQPFGANQVPHLHLDTSGNLKPFGFSAPSTVTMDLDAVFALSAG
jgi:hypothetical protein